MISGNINEVSCTKTRQLNFFLILFLVDTMSHEVVLKNRVVVFIQFFLCVSSLLTPLWENSVKILHQMATQHPQQEGLMVYCQRLQYTLQVGYQAPLVLGG